MIRGLLLVSLFTGGLFATAAEPVSRGLPRPAGPRGDTFLAGFPITETAVSARLQPPFHPSKSAPLADTLELVFFTRLQPVRVQITIHVDGQNLQAHWQSHLQRLFTRFDRDRDGVLNRFEAERIFPVKTLQLLLQGQFAYRTPDVSITFEELDRDGDNRLSLPEVAAYYQPATEAFVRPQSVTTDPTSDREMTERLFIKFDTNKDGKLSRFEMSRAEIAMLPLDTDEDETISLEEWNRVVPDKPTSTAVPKTAPKTTPQPITNPAMDDVLLTHAPVPPETASRMLTRYDTNRDGRLTLTEVGFTPERFATLDMNRDAELNLAELQAWCDGEPDYRAEVMVHHDATKRAVTLQAVRPNVPAARWEVRPGDPGRMLLRIDQQFVSISTLSPQPGATGERVTDSLRQLFPADNRKAFREEELTGPNHQFLRIVFDEVDYDCDGRIHRDEFENYLKLQQSTIDLGILATANVRTPSLFQLMDDDGDQRLSVREMRTAFDRLLPLEPHSREQVTHAAFQPLASIQFAFASYYREEQIRRSNPLTRPRSQLKTGPLWFQKMDRNNDRDLSRKEFLGPKHHFDAMDTDHDDLISVSEADSYATKASGK